MGKGFGLTFLASAMLLAGCQPAPPKSAAPRAQASAPVAPPATKPNSDVIDDCADHLHDLCGVFLLYYAQNQKLPPTADDLAAAAGPALPLICPVSRQAYVYIPDGLVAPGSPNRLVLVDPAPAHPGPDHRTRWGIVIKPPVGNKPIDAFVIPLSEQLLPAFKPAPQ